MQGLKVLSHVNDVSLRIKLMAAFALVTVLSVGLITYNNAAVLRSQLIAQQSGDLTNAAASRAAALNNVLESTLRDADVVAGSPDVVNFAAAKPTLRAPLRDLARLALLYLRNADPSFQEASIVDTSGTVILSNVNDEGKSVASTAFFAQALSGKKYVSDPSLSGSNALLVDFASPIRDPGGKIVGVLRLTTDFSGVDSQFFGKAASSGADQYNVLVDDHGVVLAAQKYADALAFRPVAALPDPVKGAMAAAKQFGPDTDSKLSRPLADGAMAAALSGGQPTGQFRHANPVAGNVDEFGGVAVVGLKPWRFVVLQPASSFLSVVNENVRQNLVIGLAVLVVVLSLAYAMSKLLLVPVHALVRVVQRIREGDLRARVENPSGDEIGQVAAQLNATLDDVLALVQTRAERDYLSNQITRLLTEVSTVAEGDLTIQAEVTPDALGSLADAFNFMVEELRKIVANVQRTSIEVATTTSAVVQSSEALAVTAESQAERVVQTSRSLDEVASTMRSVATMANDSAQVAQQARSNAESGSEAVFQTISGMHRIRETVQETSKTIKRLGESSQEIGQIVQLIEDIADQTNLLALNAAIQAAMAGEHGRGFAVVADEVRRLAERSADATKQIGTLVKSIQTETAEAVTAMDEGIREVVDGSRLADLAGQRLRAIQEVVVRLDELIQAISLSAEEQAARTIDISKTVTELSVITRDTSAGTLQTAKTLTNLQDLAEQLRASVATFKLGAAAS